jgi:hypothetical protein
MPKVLLGLDVSSTATGWALQDKTGKVTCGVFRPKGATRWQRLDAFSRDLYAFLVLHGVEHIAIEEPLVTGLEKTVTEVDTNWWGHTTKKFKKPMTSVSTYRSLYAFAGEVQRLAARLDIPCEEIHQSRWRSFFLGKERSRAPKGMSPEDRRDLLKKRAIETCGLMGIVTKSKDAAEAVGVLHTLRAMLDPRTKDLFE